MGGLALALPWQLKAQSEIVVTPLRNNLFLISNARCNVVVAVGSDSVLVVNGGIESDSGALLQEINNLAEGKPIAALFNTNWRPEHCGLNYQLGPMGSTIIAHENTRLWQNNDFYLNWEDRHYHPMPLNTQANHTFYDGDSLSLDNEVVNYGRISQFHTDGDIYINFSAANVLIAGDMMATDSYPRLDYITGGWIGGAQDCTDALLAMTDEDTLIIPSSGGVQRRAALEVQKQMLDHAYEQVAIAYKTGRSLDQFMATSPMAEYDGIYGNSDLFTELLYRGTWYHVSSYSRNNLR
jgi:cyclase